MELRAIRPSRGVTWTVNGGSAIDSPRDVNDPTSQFAYRLARGKNSREKPQAGCGCAMFLLLGIGAAFFALLLAAH